MRWVAAWVVIGCAVGCVESTIQMCPSGIVCPAKDVCSPLGGCATPEQVSACTPEPADGLCTLPGGGAGGCFSGVCLPIGCGNGIIEGNELCDDGNKLAGDGCSATCDSDERCGNGVLDLSSSEACDCGDSALPADKRPSVCAAEPNGSQVGSRCTANCQIVGCGDGIVSGLEDCDGASLGDATCVDAGFYDGTVGCMPNCKFDVTACVGRCGDDVRNGTEACDTGDLGGADCTQFGFFYPGTLTCNANCGFDTSACTGSCNDGTYDDGFEACDPGETSTALGVRGYTCETFGFYDSAGLACNSSCQFDTTACGGGSCGDGAIDSGFEDCDGAALGGLTCVSFGFHQPAGLACRSNCTFDVSQCMERCGDNTINGPEQCEGTNLGNKTCVDAGFYSGALACNAACGFEIAGCSGRCGDGTRNGPEQCEGTDVGSTTCESFGFHDPGPVGCTGGCTYDTASCTGGRCGDAVLQAVEDCEPSLGAGAFDCTDYGYYQASGLACTNACSHNTNACSQRCGDGAVNGPELCDGAPPAAYACTTLGEWSGGQRSCSGACNIANDHCHKTAFQEESPATSAQIKDVWGIGDELFAVTSGSITHTSGGAWATMSMSPTDANGVWGSSATNVYAVGAAGASWGISHFNGQAWSTVATGIASPVTLRDIHGVGATDFWAVGNAGAVLRYNGAWSRPSTGLGTTTQLNGVFAIGSQVFAVGNAGARWRFDGSAWSNSTGTGNYLAVWGRSATEIYAVNDTNTIIRWNGAAWVAAGSCGGVNDKLKAVGGLPGPSVAFVAGSEVSGRGYICQLAGGVWHELDIGTQPGITALGGSERRVAAGSTGKVFTSDGANWLPNSAIADVHLISAMGVWASSAANIYVVGEGGAAFGEVIARWNGTSWSEQTMNSPPDSDPLQAIYGGNGWAVAAGPEGHIWASNGSGGTWTLERSGPVSQTMYGVWGDSSNIYVVGEDNLAVDASLIFTRPAGGGTWTAQAAAGTGLRAIWGAPGGPVFAVGDGGVILRNSTGTWVAMTVPTPTANFGSVAGLSATDVYAFGLQSGAVVVLHFDGIVWTQMALDTDVPVANASATATTVFSGLQANLRELIGGRWLPLRIEPTSHQVQALFGLPDMLLVVDTNRLRALAGRTWSKTSTEQRCADAWDDDGDGRTDCADADCSTSTDCEGTGGCRPISSVACGQTLSSTNANGSTRWPYYGDGCVQRNNTGPEAYFRVSRATAGNITLNLTGLTADLDLVVSSTTTTANGNACTPDVACLARSQKTLTASESVTFAATANTEYILIVDGHAGATSAFQLGVMCP